MKRKLDFGKKHKKGHINVDMYEAIKDLCGLESPSNPPRTWKPFMEKYNCQIICEIGVDEGDNFSMMIEHNPKVAVAIDAWKNDWVISRNDQGYQQKELDQIYATFKARMIGKTFVKICREYSFDAVKHFPDEYFDLIYIDADHAYEACLKDIEDWYPKVKKGRFLIGDDYVDTIAPKTGVKFGVIKAVNQFARINNLQVYILPGYGWAIIKQRDLDQVHD